jgi:hypothetical protein
MLKPVNTAFYGLPGLCWTLIGRPGRTIVEPIRRWPETISEPSDLKTTVFHRFFISWHRPKKLKEMLEGPIGSFPEGAKSQEFCPVNFFNVIQLWLQLILLVQLPEILLWHFSFLR